MLKYFLGDDVILEEYINYLYCGVGVSAVSLGAAACIVYGCKSIASGVARYKLERTENGPFGTVFRIPNVVETFEGKLDKTGIKKEASTVIKEFVSTLKSNDIDTTNLYRNFRPYSVYEYEGDLCGTYDADTRTLIVDPFNLRESLLRALLEESSTVDEPSFTANGFERTNYTFLQNDEKKEVEHFGEGLNTAYSDILLERYFGIPCKVEHEELVGNVRMIEAMIGRKEMEKLFFSSRLEDLVYRSRVSHSSMEYWIKLLDTVHRSLEIGQGRPVRNLGLVKYRRLSLDVCKELTYFIRHCDAMGDTETTLEMRGILNSFLVSDDYNAKYHLSKEDKEAIVDWYEKVMGTDQRLPYAIHPRTNLS